MNEAEESGRMLLLAQKDYKALGNMLNAECFDDEIFGFHAQQAIEKTLKAWLALRNVSYPRTHDLSALLSLLETQGENCGSFFNLVEYNAFAVQYRYEAFDGTDEPLDRSAMLDQIGALINHVERLRIESTHGTPD